MEYYPRQAVWEMTLKCNMNCMHCGSKAGTKQRQELSFDKCMDVAQQLIDMNLKMITLIGGELFFKKGWEKIAKKFVDNKIYTNIITNGYHINDDQYEQIKKSGITQIGISMDGMETSHNKIRGKKDGFNEIIKTFKRLKSMGYSTEAITTISKLNIDDLEDMYKLLTSLNVDVWQMQLCSPMGNAKDKENFLISPYDVLYITNFIREKNEENKILIVAGDNIGYFDQNEKYIRGFKDAEFPGCQAGLYVVGIDSIGNVKGCLSLYDDKFIEGNLQKESLKEIWTKPNAFAYNRNFKMSDLKGKCSNCDRGNLCRGGCKQLSYFTTGNMCESIYCDYK